MAGLTASEAAAFRDAAVAFLGGKLGRAPGASREIHRASVGAGDSDIGWCSGVRGRTGVRGSPGSGSRSRLSILAAPFEFLAEGYLLCYSRWFVPDRNQVLSHLIRDATAESGHFGVIVPGDFSGVPLELREVGREVSIFLTNREQLVYGISNSVRITEDIF